MQRFRQLREGLNEAWGALAEGWQRLSRQAGNAMTRFTPGGGSREPGGAERRELAARSSGWGLLAAEVFDDDDRIIVRLEAPGMEKQDFDLQVLDDYLVVRGEKRLEREHSEGRYHVSECAYGQFRRAVPLPDAVNAEKAKASYSNGVLRVALPKLESGRRKRITVEVG